MSEENLDAEVDAKPAKKAKPDPVDPPRPAWLPLPE
jgi:hypothetical protein